MEGDPKCGIAGGNLLDINSKPMNSCRKQFESIRSLKRDHSILCNILKKFSPRRNDYNYTCKAQRVAWVCGADMMVRRCVFDEIGPFDEVIFMYAEEEEFQSRMTEKTDYTVMSVPWAQMYHLEGGSVKKRKTTFNENWEKLMLLGPPRFFYLRYGEKAVRDFLKVRIRGLKKLRFLERLLGRKGEAERHGQMIRLYQETLNDFAPYLSKLKGEGAPKGETV